MKAKQPTEILDRAIAHIMNRAAKAVTVAPDLLYAGIQRNTPESEAITILQSAINKIEKVWA